MTGTSKGQEVWLAAGQELLRRGGVGAVRLQALTDELGLTTGSFYHHFSGMSQYLDQLAAYYGSEQPRSHLAAVEDADPRVRLQRLVALAGDERMVPLDAAMRDWAGSNAAAARAVSDADEFLLRFIERAFLDLGYGRNEARTRATLLFSVGVARISPPWRIGREMSNEILEILAPVTDPPPRRRPGPSRR